MKKTAKGVQGDIIALLQDSALAEGVSGNVYHKGMRPAESRSEDIVVSFVSGIPARVQTGVVEISVCIPDIGTPPVEDIVRTTAIEALCQQWAEGLSVASSNYKFRQQQAVFTEPDPEAGQHCVVMALQYEYTE